MCLKYDFYLEQSISTLRYCYFYSKRIFLSTSDSSQCRLINNGNNQPPDEEETSWTWLNQTQVTAPAAPSRRATARSLALRSRSKMPVCVRGAPVGNVPHLRWLSPRVAGEERRRSGITRRTRGIRAVRSDPRPVPFPNSASSSLRAFVRASRVAFRVVTKKREKGKEEGGGNSRKTNKQTNKQTTKRRVLCIIPGNSHE